MHLIDYLVLVLYFVGMAAIGVWAMRRVKKQEDYFMGGRSFGKIFQTFAAFGAGTGSSDPVNTARTTFGSGMSGMWSTMYWLFVTPIYWITGVYYRRMRHITLGDWFVERYESKSLGAAYSVFGLLFYMAYSAMMFTAVNKVAIPILGISEFSLFDHLIPIEFIIVPGIALVVLIYGVLGGLTAAYWTDLIQGLFIIVLSILLIPFGLNRLVREFGQADDGMLDGFRIMHEQIPAEFFQIIGSSNSSDFPLYSIVAIVIINLVGIVVVPHFIATGGGTAKTELDARIGVVTGNMIKRFCTIGWALTALIGLALFAGSPEIAQDPDFAWGVATRELLPIGLLGLMLACLLAALMSSVDCYMIVCSALVVRNLYLPFRPKASEKQCLAIGRSTGALVVIGSVLLALLMNDIYAQLKLTWIIPMAFAAPFWLGNWWRRATRAGAWATVLYATLMFAVIPFVVPRVSNLASSEQWTAVNDIVETTTVRTAAPSDVARRKATITLWQNTTIKAGPEPTPLQLGEEIVETKASGGKPLFFSGKIVPLSAEQPLRYTILSSNTVAGVMTVRKQLEGPRKATGEFRADNLMYKILGVPLTSLSNPAIDALVLLAKVVMPFLVMIGVSLLTSRNSQAGLDRYYLKMKTPVLPDAEEDQARLARIYAREEQPERKNLFPNSSWEIQRPTVVDVAGFLGALALCFGIIGLAAWVAGIGG